MAARLTFTALRSGGRRSPTVRTVTWSKRRFRAKTKPTDWRNDYAGIEQYSAFVEEGRTLLNAKLKREHAAFAHISDANLKAQSFLEAFVRQQKGDT